MKPNKFMSIISVLTLVVFLVGATFAWFAVSAASEEGALAGEAADIRLRLDVLPLYVGKALIPTNDSDINTAFSQSCVDMYNRGACSAYTIKVKNIGHEAEYAGTINFTLENITNFKYLVLDDQGEEYKEITTVEAGQEQSLGDSLTLATNEEKVFTLIVWLPNVNYIQNDDDSDGSFGASITYQSPSGAKITGTFSA